MHNNLSTSLERVYLNMCECVCGRLSEDLAVFIVCRQSRTFYENLMSHLQFRRNVLSLVFCVRLIVDVIQQQSYSN